MTKPNKSKNNDSTPRQYNSADYYRSKLLLRPYATDSTLKWIGPRRCWHLDVWLKRAKLGQYYFYAETSEGGHVTIGASAWLVQRDIADNCMLVPVSSDWIGDKNLTRDKAVTLGDCEGKLGRELRRIYWQHIQPLGELWPRGQYPRRSVCMWFVDRFDGDCDPMAGLANDYAISGRAQRDIAMSIRKRLTGLL